MGKDTSCFALFHSVSKDELALLSQNLCGFNDPNKTQFAHMVDSTAGITLLNSQKLLKGNIFGKEENVALMKGVLCCKFNMPELKPRFCNEHKIAGMVNVLQTKPQTLSPKCQYCRDGCAFENCKVSASFNFVGLQPIFCETHKVEGMVCVKKQQTKVKNKNPTK